MHTTFTTLFALASFMLPCAAQNPLAYPQDSNQTSTGNLVPFGYGGSTSRNFDEGRFQLLIPASHLPAPGTVFIGLEVWSTSANTSSFYTSLDIAISHSPNATLSTTFAANLPTPIPVYTQQNASMFWVRRQWTPISFQMPFLYDGVSNVVVEIRKVASPATGAPSLGHGTESRSDLPLARYVFGTLGSGASQAATAQTATRNLLKVRLQVAGPTLLLRGDPNAPSNNTFGLGGAFDVEVHAIPGTVFAILGSAGFGNPAQVPTVAGLSFLNLAAPATLSIGAVPASGISGINLVIPTDLNLVGTNLVFQAPTARSSYGSRAWTNASNLIIDM